MGWYFLSDVAEGYARVSMIPSNDSEQKEETVFTGVLAGIRAGEYASWMNLRGDNGGFNREPSSPYPKAPGTPAYGLPFQRMQEAGDILPEAMGAEQGLAARDVLFGTRREVCEGESEETEEE